MEAAVAIFTMENLNQWIPLKGTSFYSLLTEDEASKKETWLLRSSYQIYQYIPQKV